MIRIEDFKQEHLDQCPVWAADESNDFLVPVADHEPLPTDLGDLVVRARFVTPNGHRFEGSVCVCSPPPFSVCLSVRGGETVSFNRAAPPDFNAKQLTRFFEILGVEPFEIFPLKYETDYHFPNQPNIAGMFDLRDS